MKRLLLFSIVGLTVFASCKNEKDTITSAEFAEGESIQMLYGETKQLHIKLSPRYVESVRAWSSSSMDVATVSPLGNVTAVGVGEAIITATTTNDDFFASCRVIVTAIGTDEIKLDKSNYEVVIGDTTKIKVTVSPDDASYKNSLIFKSTDEKVATVGIDGEIQSLNIGKCQIEVTSPDGKKAVCNLEVIPIKVTNINLKISAEKGISVKKGESYTIEVDVVPSNATNKNITWTTSDESVATVANGVVTGVAAGTAIITVKSEGDGKFSKSFTVTVTE